MTFHKTIFLVIGLALAALPLPTRAQQNPDGLALPHTAAVTDVFSPLPPDAARLTGGLLGTRINANAKNRLLHVDENDLLDAFERRDTPHQDWQGEHVGKFLHAATLAWQNTGDPALKAKLDRVVIRLLKTQEADGYLGTYPAAKRWTSWDVWCHKYALIGLLTYYQYTNVREQGTGNREQRGGASVQAANREPRAGRMGRSQAGRDTNRASTPLSGGEGHEPRAEALAACRKIGDLLIRTFGDGPGQRDINRAGAHVGMAPDSILEAVTLLYRATADPRYQAFAAYIARHYDAPGGPAILASLENTHSVRKVANAKAYEMTSNFNGILEQYRVTGNKRYLNDMLLAWQDIVDNRLYLTGSASSFELFQDDFHLPNAPSSNICETCVTVTWEQMNLELLRLTGEARFADQVERSVYNHLLAAQKPTGDDWAYYTPLEGRKPYDSATTCCHSSGPRGLALIPEFATMTGADGSVILNIYNSGVTTFALAHKRNFPFTPGIAPGKQTVTDKITLAQETAYPLDGKVKITVTPQARNVRFPLRLRIPGWARDYDIRVDGHPFCSVRVADGTPIPPACYQTIDRAWNRGDVVELSFTMPLTVIKGDHENAGKAAFMRGPLVLALDAARNAGVNIQRAELATGDASRMQTLALTTPPNGDGANIAVVGPLLKDAGRAAAPGFYNLNLTPYASAGGDGKSRFEVWIPLPGQAKTDEISLLSGGVASASRRGNASGSISDDEASTFVVTYDGHLAAQDWFAVAAEQPIEIRRVTFLHGKTFHDGGWFDTSGGKPLIQAQTTPGGAWKTIATLDAYPDTTAVSAGGLKNGQAFSVTFAPTRVIAIRVIGKPAHGDNPSQAFASCAELQAFAK